MILRTALAAFSLLAAAPALAQQPAQSPPRLVVAIAVDQFAADLFAQYRPRFTGGLRRLSGGVVFPTGYQAHAATETCPGHSTILTGSRPARTGIIANDWYDLSLTRSNKRVYCGEDPRPDGDKVSPHHLRVPALADHMERTNGAGRTVVVAGKDRAALMMGGQAPDRRWWWDHDVGRFVGHAGTDDPAGVVARTNGVIAASLGRDMPPLPLSPLCQAQSRSVAPETLPGGEPTRRRTDTAAIPIGEGRFARNAALNRRRGVDSATAFRASPEFDGTTLALAMALREAMDLGRAPGGATDLLVLGLSATDYVGHTYGTQGSEMCLQLMELDRSLGDFFARLDATGVDYMVVLTADHGGIDLPERIRQDGGLPAVRVDPALFPDAMDTALQARFGGTKRLFYGTGPFGDMYIARDIPPELRTRVMLAAVERYREHPQVAAVFTAEQLRQAPPPTGRPDEWSLLDRARASFDPARSGDFIVLLKPQVMPISAPSTTYSATHGSPWDYDRRVPILFWRRGLAPFEQPMAVETVDILPTLASFIGVTVPAGTIDGRCLDIVDGPANNCMMD